jgi:hypothetical protein
MGNVALGSVSTGVTVPALDVVKLATSPVESTTESHTCWSAQAVSPKVPPLRSAVDVWADGADGGNASSELVSSPPPVETATQRELDGQATPPTLEEAAPTGVGPDHVKESASATPIKAPTIRTTSSSSRTGLARRPGDRSAETVDLSTIKPA